MTSPNTAYALPTLAEGVADARTILATDPIVHAVAVWTGDSGSLHIWPSALVDNRRSRVLARIARYRMEEPVEFAIITR